MPTETVYSVEGRVTKLTDKELGYLEEYLKTYYGEENYSKYMTSYVVKPLWDGYKSGKSGAISTPIASIVVMLLGGFMIFRGLRVGKKAKADAQGVPVPQQAMMQQDPQYPQYPGNPEQSNTDGQNPPFRE